MHRQLLPALVTLSRFSMLLALALWVGTAVAMLLATRVLFKRLERGQAGEIAGAMLRRADYLFLVCAGLLVAGLGSRLAVDDATPPSALVALAGGMVASRLVAAFAVAPAIRALQVRLRDANAPASDAERSAFGRLHGASMLLMTLELILGACALYALS